MSHWLTNRGKLLLLQGQWDDAGGTAIKLGLLAGASTPVGIDTEAEVQDFATVATFLAVTGVDEPVGAWYTGAGVAGRVNLTRSNATQDDTNNRANMDASNVTYSAATIGETIYGAFWYDGTTNTDDTTRQLCGVILFTPVPTNGSDLTLTITDLVRAS